MCENLDNILNLYIKRQDVLITNQVPIYVQGMCLRFWTAIVTYVKEAKNSRKTMSGQGMIELWEGQFGYYQKKFIKRP